MIKQRRKTIPLSDIIIPEYIESSRPEPSKVIERTMEYAAGCKIPDIRVDRKNRLFDGYITYLILFHTGEVKAKCLVEWESRRWKE